jgi:hypothetical protein
MDPIIFQTVITQWGPFGLLAVGGWFALKWLARRDDERNAMLFQSMRDTHEVVSNNTLAMRDMGAKSDAVVAELARLEKAIAGAVKKKVRR